MFLDRLKALLARFDWDYDLMLRINCEGAEDEVIYAAHAAFGPRLLHVFGSLKDVAEVKGEAEYQALMDFMQTQNLPFTFFSSETHSWRAGQADVAKLLRRTLA